MLFQKNHILHSRKSYLTHTIFALYAGLALIVAGILSITHAIIPWILPFTSEYIIKKLLEQSEFLKKK